MISADTCLTVSSRPGRALRISDSDTSVYELLLRDVQHSLVTVHAPCGDKNLCALILTSISNRLLFHYTQNISHTVLPDCILLNSAGVQAKLTASVFKPASSSEFPCTLLTPLNCQECTGHLYSDTIPDWCESQIPAFFFPPKYVHLLPPAPVDTQPNVCALTV